jgi:hypothetical protein
VTLQIESSNGTVILRGVADPTTGEVKGNYAVTGGTCDQIGTAGPGCCGSMGLLKTVKSVIEDECDPDASDVAIRFSRALNMLKDAGSKVLASSNRVQKSSTKAGNFSFS